MNLSSKEEVKLLLKGVIPEREVEIDNYLEKYAPHIARYDDRIGFSVEAGPYNMLNFTQRTMHQMWILGFAANRALHSNSAFIFLSNQIGELDTEELNQLEGQYVEDCKYKEMISAVYELGNLSEISEYSWPSEVPKPRDKRPNDLEGAATFDLICMSGAYIFLHEMKHIVFAHDENAPLNPHEEELQCDLYAKSMMLDKLKDYSKQSGYDLTKLYTKRTISISLALFYVLVITPVEKWRGSDSHPSISNRIDNFISDLSIPDNDISWLYMSSLFLSHLRLISQKRMRIKFNSPKDLMIKLITEIETISNN